MLCSGGASSAMRAGARSARFPGQAVGRLNCAAQHSPILAGSMRRRSSPQRAATAARSMSDLFAKPVITLEDLERRLIALLEGNDSVRSLPSASFSALCWATHCRADHCGFVCCSRCGRSP